MKRNGIENSYCIAEKEKFKLRGIFGSPVFEQIDLRLNLCENETYHNKCASSE